MVILDIIAFLRYLCIFHFQNPAAIQDAFWSWFINQFIAVLGILLYVIYEMDPNFQLSTIMNGCGSVTQNGTVGESIGNETNAKRSYFMKVTSSLVIISFILHLFIGIKVTIYKRKAKRQVNNV